MKKNYRHEATAAKNYVYKNAGATEKIISFIRNNKLA